MDLCIYFLYYNHNDIMLNILPPTRTCALNLHFDLCLLINMPTVIQQGIAYNMLLHRDKII